MTNYKAMSRTIEIGRVRTPVPIGSTIVTLNENVDGSNAADGFLDVSDNLIYSVPAGKTFRILGIKITTGTAAAVSTIVISTGDTENAETATLLTLQIPNISGFNLFIATDITLASAKFLTHNPSGTEVDFIQVFGYEF